MKLDEWSQSIFSPDSPIIRIVGKYADLMVLNVFWLVCSLPVVTIGASSTALFCAVKAVREEEDGVFRLFWTTFRRKFWKATALWLIFLATGMLIAFNLWFAYTFLQTGRLLLMGLWIFMFAAFMLCANCAFLVLADKEATLWMIVREAFWLGIAGLGYTVIIIFLNFLPLLFAAAFPYYFLLSLLVWILFGFALIAYIDSWLFSKTLNRVTR